MKPLNILIVDDEPSIRSIIRAGLTSYGKDANCFFEEAQDGEDALAKLKRKIFNLIFLDILLPGISGVKVLEWIQENVKPMPIVIVLTGINDMRMRARCWELGAHVVIPKTDFDPTELADFLAVARSRIKHSTPVDISLFATEPTSSAPEPLPLELTHRPTKSLVVLGASLAIALSGWLGHFSGWAEITQISAVGSLIGLIGGIIVAWLGESPISTKWDGTERRGSK